jgi:hypothetical protein
MQTLSRDAGTDASMEARLRSLLASAMEEEVGMLDTLREIFVAQREALSAGDPAALDDGVFAATRVIRTLDEARRRRRGITASLIGSEVDGDELDTYLTGSATRPVRQAREHLRAAAERLRGEVALLRRILGVALQDNRVYLEALLGDGGHSAGRRPAYTPGGAQAQADVGVVLDRTA